jgi:histidine triad (HIT) family protein
VAGESAPVECEFCSILRGENSARIVAETDDVLAFFPFAPAVVGHTLLIPKLHIPDLWKLDSLMATVLTRALLPLAEAIRDAFDPEGINIIHSTGEAASQSVRHFHVHLVPRWTGDPMGDIWPQQEESPPEVLDAALLSLRQSLSW